MTDFQTSNINSSLQVFFTTMLQEIYWSEQHLVNVLQSMRDAASATELKHAFEKHEQQTQTHVRRVEEAMDILGADHYAKHCVGLQGLFDEGWQVIDETEPNTAQRDVALLIAAQKVEHYEMACYGSIVTLARTLGQNDIAELLAETLVEEKETDADLTLIAEGKLNKKASKEPAAKVPVRKASTGKRTEPKQTTKVAATSKTTKKKA